jgi:hypothetical protein
MSNIENKNEWERKFRQYMIAKHDGDELNEMTVHNMAYSSPEAAKEAAAATKKLSDELGKVSQKIIKSMINDIKGHKYSPLDLMRSFKEGSVRDSHAYEKDFLTSLWHRASNRFRKYMPKGKMSF